MSRHAFFRLGRSGLTRQCLPQRRPRAEPTPHTSLAGAASARCAQMRSGTQNHRALVVSIRFAPASACLHRCADIEALLRVGVFARHVFNCASRCCLDCARTYDARAFASPSIPMDADDATPTASEVHETLVYQTCEGFPGGMPEAINIARPEKAVMLAKSEARG